MHGQHFVHRYCYTCDGYVVAHTLRDMESWMVSAMSNAHRSVSKHELLDVMRSVAGSPSRATTVDKAADSSLLDVMRSAAGSPSRASTADKTADSSPDLDLTPALDSKALSASCLCYCLVPWVWHQLRCTLAQSTANLSKLPWYMSGSTTATKCQAADDTCIMWGNM